MSAQTLGGSECIKAHHDPVNSIIRVRFDDSFLDAVTIRTAAIINPRLTKRPADLAQFKLDTQPYALLARKLCI